MISKKESSVLTIVKQCDISDWRILDFPQLFMKLICQFVALSDSPVPVDMLGIATLKNSKLGHFGFKMQVACLS